MLNVQQVRLWVLMGLTVLAAACADGPQAGLDADASAEANLTAQTTGALTARVNKSACLDVLDRRRDSGAPVQIWSCTGGENQLWQVTGSSVVVYGKLCLSALGGDNRSAVVVATCNPSDTSQKWTVNGEQLVHAASGRCLDVRDGGQANGTRLQLWDCARGNINQAWLMPNEQATQGGTGSAAAEPGKEVTTPAIAVPTNSDKVNAAVYQSVNFADWGIKGNFSALPLTKLLALHPQLAKYQQDLINAAAQANPVIPPQLLVAICLQESSGGLDTSGGGPFQFSDDGAWKAYGPAQGDRYNFAQGAIGAANYMAAELRMRDGDLNAALRTYNGPIAWGGKPSYQSEIQQWMQGVFVYGSGV